jgi:hypothetical protein
MAWELLEEMIRGNVGRGSHFEMKMTIQFSLAGVVWKQLGFGDAWSFGEAYFCEL